MSPQEKRFWIALLALAAIAKVATFYIRSV